MLLLKMKFYGDSAYFLSKLGTVTAISHKEVLPEEFVGKPVYEALVYLEQNGYGYVSHNAEDSEQTRWNLTKK